jgi:hypothetical protein
MPREVNRNSVLDDAVSGSMTDDPAASNASGREEIGTGARRRDLWAPQTVNSTQLVQFALHASISLPRHDGPEFVNLTRGVAIQEGQQLSVQHSSR